MADFVQECRYTYRASGKAGTDPDEAVDSPVRLDSKNLRHARTDKEVRLAVDACAGRQIGAVEETGLAKGQQISSQLLVSEEVPKVDTSLGNVLVL